MNGAPVCRYLDWDSDFFGLRIGRVTASSLNARELQKIVEWGRDEKIDCLYFLCPLADVQSAQAAEVAGFHLIDARVTLETKLPRSPTQAADFQKCIRAQCPDDVDALKAIAKVSHHQTRFFADPHFPRPRSEALYETWIEKSCASAANQVLVATSPEGVVQGYITCEIHEDATGSIGLVAIVESAQGKGLGQALVKEALAHFQAHGCSAVTVVTQGQNLTAQRLYQRCGFLTRSVELWFHYWPGSKDRLNL